MKFAIIIPDGCADLPLKELGGKTPMQVARTPHLDALAKRGIVGRSHNVPDGFSPGSDVATLGLLGYSPREFYTGRAPLEAAAMGIELADDDWAVRCNLVTINEADEQTVMRSFTAGHISSEESAALLETLNANFAVNSSPPMRFYPGVSYRNLLVVKDGDLFSSATPSSLTRSPTKTFPPHDYTDMPIANAMPQGMGADKLMLWMAESQRIFADHPVNRARIANGKWPATQVWLWGLGQKPRLPLFRDKFASLLRGKTKGGTFRAAMITAVDLLRGIASLIGWDNLDVPGITGYVDTDFAAKGRFAAKALQEYDLVCVHVEATDEAGHEGSAAKKIKALEDIDASVLPPVLEALESSREDWRLLVSPDHPTPVALKTHTSDFVPWLIAGSDITVSAASKPVDDEASFDDAVFEAVFDEESAANSKFRFDDGWNMIEFLLQ